MLGCSCHGHGSIARGQDVYVGGELEVRSELSVGTRLSMRIPLELEGS